MLTMKGFLWLLVLSAAAAAVVSAASPSTTTSPTLSKEGAELVKDIENGVGGLAKKCKDAFMAKINLAKNDDAKLDKSCEDVKASATNLLKSCSQSDYDKGKKVICDKVTKWKVALAKRKFDILTVTNKFSAKCQSAVKAYSHTTWLDIDRLCEGTKSQVCHQHCSGDECDKLKDAACSAPAMVAGFLTLVLCLLGQAFKKL